MSGLNEVERRALETLLDMSGGFVLGMGGAKLAKLLGRHGVNWATIGRDQGVLSTSKAAKKLRAVWDDAPDEVVAAVTSELLDVYEMQCRESGEDPNDGLLSRAREGVARLSAPPLVRVDEPAFLEREFVIPTISRLSIDPTLHAVIEARVAEARLAFKAGAHLSVVLLCGSVLEAVLLGAARANAERFNRASRCPKNRDGAPMPFREWRLSALIDVSHELRLLGSDVHKFSHALRDFRNHIHPDEQLRSGFVPDRHTARLCLHTLIAALSDLAGARA